MIMLHMHISILLIGSALHSILEFAAESRRRQQIESFTHRGQLHSLAHYMHDNGRVEIPEMEYMTFMLHTAGLVDDNIELSLHEAWKRVLSSHVRVSHPRNLDGPLERGKIFLPTFE